MNEILENLLTIDECDEIYSALKLQIKPRKNVDEFIHYASTFENLKETLKYVPKFEAIIKEKYGNNFVFKVSYSRIYRKDDFLKIHLDKPIYDLTVSLCIKKESKNPWPLKISKKLWIGVWDWHHKVDRSPWTAEYDSYDLEPGQAVICEGNVYPHWRETLECEENEGNSYVFFLWSKVDK